MKQPGERTQLSGGMVARIALEPGETFQHQHQQGSITILHSGTVKFSVAGTSQLLLPGQPVFVGADEPHVMTNTGAVLALVDCEAHGPGEGDSDDGDGDGDGGGKSVGY
jgi:quercetin dioxygenase-like cupin family protein